MSSHIDTSIDTSIEKLKIVHEILPKCSVRREIPTVGNRPCSFKENYLVKETSKHTPRVFYDTTK